LCGSSLITCINPFTLNNEIPKVKRAIKAEIVKDMGVLKTKVDKLETHCQQIIDKGDIQDNRVCNFVVKSLPEDSRESVENSKVLINQLEGLIKDGLKLNKVNITKAIRKISDGKRPGVIIEFVGGVDKKKEVMKAKRQLKNNRKYSYVFIENDKSYEQRLYEANNKKLLNLIGTKDHIVKGGRILRIQDIW
jgi:hypothetical protein